MSSGEEASLSVSIASREEADSFVPSAQLLSPSVWKYSSLSCLTTGASWECEGDDISLKRGSNFEGELRDSVIEQPLLLDVERLSEGFREEACCFLGDRVGGAGGVAG